MTQHTQPACFEALKAESSIRGESCLSRVCKRPFEEHAQPLEGMAPLQNGRVHEVCNPRLAAQLSTINAWLDHVLPGRISLHDWDGVATVRTPMPSAPMAGSLHAAQVARLVRSAEAVQQCVPSGLCGLGAVRASSAVAGVTKASRLRTV